MVTGNKTGSPGFAKTTLGVWQEGGLSDSCSNKWEADQCNNAFLSCCCKVTKATAVVPCYDWQPAPVQINWLGGGV